MKKKMFGALLLSACALVTLGACGGGKNDEKSSDGKVELNLAVFEGGYGKEIYEKAVEAYKEVNPDVTIKLNASKTIEDEIIPSMKAGKFPDLMVLGQGAKSGLVESLIKDKSLEDVTDVLDMKVPSEEKVLKDKLVQGIVDNLATNPYGDEKTYLMPMYYAPTGLVYNKGLLKEKGWEEPKTMEEFFALGDKAKKEGIALFTYPTAGYMDSYFNSLFASIGGTKFFDEVMTYKKGVWESEDAKEALEITGKLLKNYTAKETVGNANAQDFTKNQQMILDNKALFMPNGTWIVQEMENAPRAKDFQWAIMPLPAMKSGGERYITTSVESAWIPKEAKQKKAAKEFMAFLYSDKVADIFLTANAVQPIKDITNKISEEAKPFYDAYNQEGVQALVGRFASTDAVEGVNISNTLYDTSNSIITGDKTVEQWQKDLNTVSEKLREAKD
ncbi:carbohydrate ABC transporter substrate-binding protein, CUT1 family (TC 3.A.1.1.-) [Pilibacter termitis]|uniref:Carbohydrate ABC transporter substrate-binding protein, CUT1 family (TC 3.A.1.1.-) n=1 Tax=Pilibacter termitis TaxID=263852 RepID=A0A1T4QRQ2_9ENTE|nr:carbohydrate ABC transporter substrate-binding protein [Pilibacter termitis]SKA05928.1 carbohydrate ABC transporter substrate-binding protein, CUT1 family (TC 3.A.1.1.-) [Pilibacter termitis]